MRLDHDLANKNLIILHLFPRLVVVVPLGDLPVGHEKTKMKPTNPNANTFENYICPNDTLVGHSCGTLLSETLVGQSYGTLLWDTLVGYSCRTLLWVTLVGNSCGTILRDSLVGHSCWILL